MKRSTSFFYSFFSSHIFSFFLFFFSLLPYPITYLSFPSIFFLFFFNFQIPCYFLRYMPSLNSSLITLNPLSFCTSSPPSCFSTPCNSFNLFFPYLFRPLPFCPFLTTFRLSSLPPFPSLVCYLPFVLFTLFLP